ncbi:PREDICTED: cytosolic carboxypeptidase 2-like [Acropora digitifera]|uniref:cytosolic carboxypeptidase 2-like n=1 Tax=Acropora digitifera TaxID=70779 RepID=UPI000779F38A|nr:PREDICTED: cytosolic carboxypeptidase 2-like [Acropora digitifera]
MRICMLTVGLTGSNDWYCLLTGMKPLMYSEREATVRGLGWKRAGTHISYCKTSLFKSLSLHRENVYHTLTFHIEFPHEGDTCYLAHCYPYSYTDLELYLRTIMENRKTAQYFHKEVLCKTMAGNNCYVLTVTSSKVPESEKLGVVISARVHPGETNASWMLKGMLDFLTSGHYIAEKLRRKFVFKLVPMLNPDGVIVGNYRTNLAARDLNRTYKDPKKESFPTVWHMKNMLEAFKKDHQVRGLKHATFFGANFGDMAKGRHFHVGDFEEMGRHFCEVLLEYSEAKSSDRSEMTQAFVELACKMTRDILRQTLGNYHLDNKDSVCIPRDETSEQKEGQRSDSPSEGNQDDGNKSSEFGVKAFPSSNGRPVSFMDVRVDAVKKQDVDVELSVKSVHAESFNDCLKILDNLNIVDRFDEPIVVTNSR